MSDPNQEEQLYAQAAAKLDGENRDEGLWAKCFAECDGEENKAKALYLKTRVERLTEKALPTKKHSEQTELKERLGDEAFQMLAQVTGPRLTIEAAEKGDAPSQDCLGTMHYYGDRVDLDFKEAVKWYRKAAKQGFAKAECHLGSCYYRGHGVKKDYEQAVKWFRKSAEQGYAQAQYYLGVRYDLGQGVEQNF